MKPITMTRCLRFPVTALLLLGYDWDADQISRCLANGLPEVAREWLRLATRDLGVV